MKYLLFPLIFLVVILIPLTVLAANPSVSGSLLAMDCYNTAGGCGVCDIISLVNIIVRLILSLAGIASLVMFVWAGLEMVMSAGSPDKIKSAKTKIIGSLTGILIIYFAWVGVNLIIEKFTANNASVFSLGAWNKLECVSEPTTYLQQVESGVQPSGEYKAPDGFIYGKTDLGAGSGCKSKWEIGAQRTSCQKNNACLGFSPHNIKPDQCYDASAALARVLNRMSALLGTQDFRYSLLKKSNILISSISDDNGIASCREHYISPPCFHSQGSHYGVQGSKAIDLITAVNFDKADVREQLMTLIRDSGGTPTYEGAGQNKYTTGAHIHVEVN